jgi:hypothetical protein
VVVLIRMHGLVLRKIINHIQCQSSTRNYECIILVLRFRAQRMGLSLFHYFIPFLNEEDDGMSESVSAGSLRLFN